MIQIVRSTDGKWCNHEPNDPERVPKNAAWIDLMAPTAEEERHLEAILGVDLPTKEDLKDIEPSSRLYRRNNAIFLTATLVRGVGKGRPRTTEVAFILHEGRLITVRYAELTAFDLFAADLVRDADRCRDGATTLVNLLEAIVDGCAEILQRTGDQVDELPERIFPRRIAAVAGATRRSWKRS